MNKLSIDVSPKQLSRLRNGHRVRVKQGTGVNLLVDPSKFNSATRSFSRGSAYQMQLSPEELMANKEAVMNGEIEGEGIFKGGRINIGKAFKSFGKKVDKGFKSFGRKTKKGLETAGKATLKGLKTAEKELRKNPVTRKIVKTAVPLLAEAAVTGLSTYAGMDPNTAKMFGKIGGKSAEAGLTEAGYGLYAGRGMSGGLLGPPSRLPEVSSISGRGALLPHSNASLPVAMRSDPMGANFHMNTQLPPQFQRGGVKFV